MTFTQMTLLPDISEAPPKPKNGSSSEMESWCFNVAQKKRLAMHKDLITMLNDSMTGSAHPLTHLQPYFPSNEGFARIPSDWDYTIEGYCIGFQTDILWITLRDWYGWGILTQEGIDIIKTICPHGLNEFGQGTGFNAKSLRAHGIPTTSSECFDRGYDGLGVWEHPDHSDGINLDQNSPLPLLVIWGDSKTDFSWLSQWPKGKILIEGGNEKYCGLKHNKLKDWGFILTEDHEDCLLSCSGSPGSLRIWKKQNNLINTSCCLKQNLL